MKGILQVSDNSLPISNAPLTGSSPRGRLVKPTPGGQQWAITLLKGGFAKMVKYFKTRHPSQHGMAGGKRMGPRRRGSAAEGIRHLGRFMRHWIMRRIILASFSFLFSEHQDILLSSCEGPLATVLENGSFKVREVQAKEQKEQLLRMWDCSNALRLEKGRHPVGNKATH